ncbi:MAG TPA: carbon-nitrogen hydrolase family protein [Opitutaceae bacterium]|jgi:predicted amidohydrolase
MRPRARLAQVLKAPLKAAVLGAALALPLAAVASGPAVARYDRLPRKVLVGTAVGGAQLVNMTLERRLNEMDRLTSEMSAQAARKYPSKRLDLVVLPEFFLGRPGSRMPEESVRLADVQDRIARCARSHGCYMVVPVLMREEGAPARYSNAAVLAGRDGRVVGIYRKVHPVAPQGTDDLEGGTTPGPGFPVFDCDFGRLGIQICFDMTYSDGWSSLARQGAEIVAMPSASAESVRPSFYALQYGYYIVSATSQDNAAVYSPLGLIEANVTKPSVLVDEIDLSYEILHWEAALEDGEALRRRYGDKVGFHYYVREDNGILWSNDPGMTIGQMVRSINLVDSAANARRVRALEDRARGGPPEAP